MKFLKHSNLEGKHGFLGASKFHWIRYSDEKIAESYKKFCDKYPSDKTRLCIYGRGSAVDEYKKLSKSDSDNEIEICIDAMYALLLLKLQHKSISEETAQAMQTFGALLAIVAEVYKNLKIRGFED